MANAQYISKGSKFEQCNLEKRPRMTLGFYLFSLFSKQKNNELQNS